MGRPFPSKIIIIFLFAKTAKIRDGRIFIILAKIEPTILHTRTHYVLMHNAYKYGAQAASPILTKIKRAPIFLDE